MSESAHDAEPEGSQGVEQRPADWVDWHAQYDEPGSRLARRLVVVQRQLAAALDERHGDVTLISMCAGQGRDVIPVLAAHPRRADVRALLVELDEHNAAGAEQGAREAGLDRLEVRRADAALTGAYASHVPADIILACGIFGNITMADIERTVRSLPSLAARGATVIWTRGRFRDGDVTPQIRAWFADSGFEELDFDAPEDWKFAVGTNRLVAAPQPFEAGVRMFTFFR